MMKKMLALLLALLTVAALSACSKDGDDNIDNLDQFKENEIVYESITVGSSTFYFETLDSDSVAITGYKGPSEPHDITVPTEVVISNKDDSTRKVTAIAENAFYAVNALRSVVIPEGITEIGQFAFANCAQLASVTLPASIEALGRGAFYSSGLTTVSFPASCGLTAIAPEAFGKCVKLTSVTIPAYIETVGDSAFFECSAIETVVLSEGVKTVGSKAFYGTVALKSLTLPATFENVDPIVDLAFSGSNVLYRENITCNGEAATAYADKMVLQDKPEAEA